MVASCLQILINVTYYSVNTSIFLSSCPGFLTTVIALINNSETAEDAVWLFSHICGDGQIELSSLHQATILELFAQKLNEGALSLDLTCNTANLLLDEKRKVTLGAEALIRTIQEKLYEGGPYT